MATRTGPACVHHSDRGGVAQCVACGVVLCAACTTRIRGRNLCAACLGAQLASADVDAPAAGLVADVVAGTLGVAGIALLSAAGVGLFAVFHALG